jgi:AraC-like DNA-binding protein
MAYNAVDADADTFAVQKDLDELVLLLKGHDAAEVSSRGHQLAARIRTAAAAMGNCCLRVAMGTPQQRLSDVQHSLTAALLQLQNAAQRDLHDAIVDEGAGYAKVLAFRDVQGGKRVPAVIERARDFIEQHFHEPGLSLQEVAEYVHLSANHFSSIFSSAAGETFKEYVTRLRIERAKELLRGTEQSAADICYAVGYSDPHYFSAAFKKATGMSPRQFRSPTDVDDDERMV